VQVHEFMIRLWLGSTCLPVGRDAGLVNRLSSWSILYTLLARQSVWRGLYPTTIPASLPLPFLYPVSSTPI